ncbi:MAG: type II toxin-antitoxin system RelE/ParE family toxin [Pyrinomonadaceae bacterium]
MADLTTLFAIQADLLENPKRGEVIQGCGGVSKARIADARGSKGKRGGFRFIYLYLESVETVFLLMLYAKNERAVLSGDEKKIIATLAKQYKEFYGEE